MSKRTVWVVLGVVVGAPFIGIQFLRPVIRSNPEPDPRRLLSAHVATAPGVDSILRRACYDCHSFETRWPLYSRIAPLSWLVQADILSARSDLNFSEWSVDTEREPTPRQRLGFICSDVRRDIMPPRPYLIMHPSARLTPDEVTRICAWTDDARQALLSEVAKQ